MTTKIAFKDVVKTFPKKDTTFVALDQNDKPREIAAKEESNG